MKESFRKIQFLHFEWFILLSGLTAMALLNPYAESASFCIIDRMGFGFCPGTGLGRSIALLFRGEFSASLEMNILGIPALLIISSRVAKIWKRNLNIYGDTP